MKKTGCKVATFSVYRKMIYVCSMKGEKEMEIIVVIVFAILAAKETRKVRNNPGYKSWMDGSPDWWWWGKDK